MSIPDTIPLSDLVSLADTGTWGDEATEHDGQPVLRSSNIQDYRLDLSECAWRKIPQKHIVEKRLEDGDIIVTMSSGSAHLIGKCCIYRQRGELPYYFSNFTLRLRADSAVADARWLFYWLSSPRARAAISSMSATTSGLRNLNRGRYLSQRVPKVPLPAQQETAALLDRIGASREKLRDAGALLEQLHVAVMERSLQGP